MTISGALTREADNPLFAQGGGGAWDEEKIGPLNIIKVGPGDYRLWYEGIAAGAGPDYTTSMGYATSTDGRNWTKNGGNPIFVATEVWENDEVAPDTIIRVSATDWRMWYHGGGNTMPRKIGYATSSDGITWTRGNGSLPVLSPGAASAWDDAYVADACVMRVSATDYRMWYHGGTATVGAIGYATSTDGITWVKSGSNPIFSNGAGGQWDDDFVHGLWVFRRGGDPRFHGWYSGGDIGVNDGGVGYAWSLNGITGWTRGASNPVLSGLSTEEISDPVFVYEDDGILRVIYYWDDFGESPVERVHGEARGSPAPDPLTICVTASADDWTISRDSGGYPPTGGGGANDTGTEVGVRKISVPFDEIQCGLVRFDTSILPDSAVISAVQLQLYMVSVADNDNRSLVAEWRTFNPPATDADWIENVGTTAIAGTDLTSLTVGAVNTFTLSNPTNVNKTGWTGLRFGISGTEPLVGDNSVNFASFDDPTNPAPCLVVTYTDNAIVAWIRL